MKRASIQYKTLLACLVVGVGAAGFWAARPHAAPHKLTAAQTLDAIPAAKHPSASDTEIAKWTERTRHDEKNDNAWATLGDVLMQKARETVDVTYYTHAERAYQRALELNSKNIEALVGLAWANGGRHEFEQSIEWAKKALALDPGRQEAYGLLGDAAVEMGDYDGAFAHYQKMLDIRPDLSSYSRGAHLLHLTGNTTKAIMVMAQAIHAGGIYAENTAWCRAQLALILFGNGNVVAAENTLEAALKQSPNNPYLLAAMGKVKAARGNYQSAIDSYQKAVAIVPMHDSLVALGDLYRLIGKPEEAEKQYALVETIHQLNKANGVKGDMQIARFYADHDRNLPEALQQAQAEYATRKNVFVADTLAWALYKNGRYPEAKEMMKKAMSQKTPDSAIQFHAGMIYAKLGERSHAQLCLYRALNWNPKFSPIDAPIALETFHRLGSPSPNARQAALAPGEESSLR